jgi:hypothetical protein
MKQFADKDHPGLDFTRLARDIFETESLAGRHHCISALWLSIRTETFSEAYSFALYFKSAIGAVIKTIPPAYETVR